MRLKKFEEFTFNKEKKELEVQPKPKKKSTVLKKSRKIPIQLPSWNIY